MNAASPFQLEVPRAAHVNGTATARKGTLRRVGSLRLGDILIDEGLATNDDVQKALRLQSASRTYRPLGHILVTQKVITRRQLLSVLERHQRYSKIGEILVKTKVITTEQLERARRAAADRKSTRLNSSHVAISYAVFCLKKKTQILSVGFELAWVLSWVLLATDFFTSWVFLGCTSTTVLSKPCWECVEGTGAGGGVATTT